MSASSSSPIKDAAPAPKAAAPSPKAFAFLLGILESVFSILGPAFATALSKGFLIFVLNPCEMSAEVSSNAFLRRLSGFASSASIRAFSAAYSASLLALSLRGVTNTPLAALMAPPALYPGISFLPAPPDCLLTSMSLMRGRAPLPESLLLWVISRFIVDLVRVGALTAPPLA